MIVLSKKAAGTLLAAALLSVSSLADTHVVKPFASQDEIFKEFNKLHEDMNRIFEKFDAKMFSSDFKSRFFDDMAMKSPKMDIKDKKDHYEIKVDLPGSKDTSIQTKVKDHILSIDAKVEKEEEKKEEHFIQKERFFNAYHRAITLPDDANGDKLKSTYKEGVLTITIPKK